jgi:hypothetical protein
MNFEENFQNVSDYDMIDLDKNIENMQDVKDLKVEVEEEEEEDVKEEMMDVTEAGNDKKVFNELNNKFKKSNPEIEGFKGGEEKKYNDNKLVLKSILFGLLFYLLSNQKIYDLTKPYLNGLDKNLVHSIVFIILFYLINIVI